MGYFIKSLWELSAVPNQNYSFLSTLFILAIRSVLNTKYSVNIEINNTRIYTFQVSFKNMVYFELAIHPEIWLYSSLDRSNWETLQTNNSKIKCDLRLAKFQGTYCSTRLWKSNNSNFCFTTIKTTLIVTQVRTWNIDKYYGICICISAVFSLVICLTWMKLSP